MTRQDFIDYLEANDCETVRIANQGYYVMRNIKTKNLSGVPNTDPPLDATVCRICKTLEVKPPDISSGAQELIDRIHNEFSNGNIKKD